MTSRKSNKVGSKPVNKVPPKKNGKKQMNKSRRRDLKNISASEAAGMAIGLSDNRPD